MATIEVSRIDTLPNRSLEVFFDYRTPDSNEAEPSTQPPQDEQTPPIQPNANGNGCFPI